MGETHSIPDYPLDLTFEQVWACIQEIAEYQRKNEERWERSARIEQERSEHEARIEQERSERETRLEQERSEREARLEQERSEREVQLEQEREKERKAREERDAQLEQEREKERRELDARLDQERRELDARLDQERRERDAQLEQEREKERKAREERNARLDQERSEREARLQQEREKERRERDAQIEQERKEREAWLKQKRIEDAERDKRVAKEMEKLNKIIGKLGNRFGEMLEYMVSPGLLSKFKDLGFEFESLSQDKSISVKGEIIAELDMFLESIDKVLIVEMKSKPDINDIKEHIDRMGLLRSWADSWGDKRKYYGAMGGMIFSKEIRNYTLKRGFFVVEPSGESFKLIAPQGEFMPRVW